MWSSIKACRWQSRGLLGLEGSANQDAHAPIPLPGLISASLLVATVNSPRTVDVPLGGLSLPKMVGQRRFLDLRHGACFLRPASALSNSMMAEVLREGSSCRKKYRPASISASSVTRGSPLSCLGKGLSALDSRLRNDLSTFINVTLIMPKHPSAQAAL